MNMKWDMLYVRSLGTVKIELRHRGDAVGCGAMHVIGNSSHGLFLFRRRRRNECPSIVTEAETKMMQIQSLYDMCVVVK